MGCQALRLPSRQRSTIQIACIRKDHIRSIGGRETKQAGFICMHRDCQPCRKHHQTKFFFHNSKINLYAGKVIHFAHLRKKQAEKIEGTVGRKQI